MPLCFCSLFGQYNYKLPKQSVFNSDLVNIVSQAHGATHIFVEYDETSSNPRGTPKVLNIGCFVPYRDFSIPLHLDIPVR